MEFQFIKDLITAELPDAFVEVSDLTGTKDHLAILVVSDSFEGKILIKQHQIIMDILKESLKKEIHAVQLKTLTKKKADAQGIHYQ